MNGRLKDKHADLAVQLATCGGSRSNYGETGIHLSPFLLLNFKGPVTGLGTSFCFNFQCLELYTPSMCFRVTKHACAMEISSATSSFQLATKVP
jgi:hypothetical protein